MNKQPQRTITIVLTDVPDRLNRPLPCRLKRLLKHALRSESLRVLTYHGDLLTAPDEAKPTVRQ
jgi:hypothetical protein